MNIKDKLKAFFVHLFLSLVIALICLTLVYWVWYPVPLDKATGVKKIFQLMIGIDLIIGPVLTFVIFKKNKKTLKFDLGVIVCLQLIALIYGIYKVEEGRPIWIVYNVDRFDLIRVSDLDHQRNNFKILAEYKVRNWNGPNYVDAHIPMEDIKVRNEVLFDELQNSISPSQRRELYKPLVTAKNKIIKHAQKIDILKQFNDSKSVDFIIKKYPTATAWLPLKANAVDMVVLINKEKGEVIKIVDLRPWK